MREVLIRNDVIQVILQGFRDIMSACPLCQTEFDPLQSGQLCPQCRDDVLAKDAYTPQDFRFVGFLAGVLLAAVSSMPGAFVGDLIGRSVGNPLRCCTIGVVVFSLLGFVAGCFLGPAMVRRIEAAKRTA